VNEKDIILNFYNYIHQNIIITCFQDAVNNGEGMGVFEMTHRSLFAIIWWSLCKRSSSFSYLIEERIEDSDFQKNSWIFHLDFIFFTLSKQSNQIFLCSYFYNLGPCINWNGYV